MPTAISSRLFQVAPPPQITVDWDNYDDTPTIYISDNAALNQITITLKNGLANSLTFPSGTPVAYGSLPAGQSAIYISFTNLLPASSIAGMTATAEGWAAQTFNTSSLGQYLVLAPTSTVPLASGEALTFTLSNFTCPGPVASAYVDFVLSGVTGTTQTNPIPVLVQVANPPTAKNQSLDLLVGFSQTDTVFTGANASNGLVLTLANPASQPLVPQGAGAWTATPTFQLNLVFDSSAPGALTTAALGAQISVNNGEMYGNDWAPVQANTSGPSPYWVMQPNKTTAGGVVLGAGSSTNASVSFNITDIVTTLPQGLTIATLSYWNIPGYNDGQYALEIIKIDPVVVSSFTASPSGPIATPTGPVDVTLDFTVQNASGVVIVNTPYTAQATGTTFSGSVTVPVSTPTCFTLIATNFNTAQQVAATVTVDMTPDPYHAIPAGAIIMWSSANVPSGWAICNGQTVGGYTTPNLVNQFILGADPSAPGDNSGEAVGTSGGPDSHSHNFTATFSVTTNSDGAHQHQMTIPQGSFTYSSGDQTSPTLLDGDSASGTTYWPQTLPGQGDHQHTFPVTVPTTATATQSSTTMRPAWYALYYIMKCY